VSQVYQQPNQDILRREDDPEDGKHWPDYPINEIDAEEREMLLQQAGVVGENARMAWEAYQREEQGQDGDEPQGVMKEQVRLQEMGQPAPPAPPRTGDPEVDRGSYPTGPLGGTLPDSETDEVEEGDAQGAAAETGGEDERKQAEAKAKDRGLEIRDYGTTGEWRVYDPSTGRQVAKSRLDEGRVDTAGAPPPDKQPA
jgi:hypothetical protein